MRFHLGLALFLLVLALLASPARAASDEQRIEEAQAERKKWEDFGKEENARYKKAFDTVNALPESRREAYRWCNDKGDTGGVSWIEKPPAPRCAPPPGKQGTPNSSFYAGLKGVSLNIRIKPDPRSYTLDRAMLQSVLAREIERGIMPYVEQDEQCRLPALHIADEGNNLRDAAPPPADRDDTLSIVADLIYNHDSSPPSATVTMSQYRWRADCHGIFPHRSESLALPMNLPAAQIKTMLGIFARRLAEGSWHNGGFTPVPLPEERKMWRMLRVTCAPDRDFFEAKQITVIMTDKQRVGFHMLENPEKKPVQVFGDTAYYRRLPAPEGGLKIPLCALKTRSIGIDAGGLPYSLALTESTADGERRFDISIRPKDAKSAPSPAFDAQAARYALSINSKAAGTLEFCRHRDGRASCVPAPVIDGKVPAVLSMPSIEENYRAEMVKKARDGDAAAQAYACRAARAANDYFGLYGNQGVCLRGAERGINYCRLLSKADSYIGDLDLLMREYTKLRVTFKDKDMEPIYWCLGAAKAGDAHAQYTVGEIYKWTSTGERPYLEDSARWLRAAADQGLPEAQSAYAQVLSDDRYHDYAGTPIDLAGAFELSMKAAQQGDGAGIGRVAYAYLKGWGTPVNYAESYFWHSLWGYGFVEPAWHLTAEEVAAIQARVEAWQPKMPAHP